MVQCLHIVHTEWAPLVAGARVCSNAVSYQVMMPNIAIIPTAAPDVPPLRAVVDEFGAETTNDLTPVSLTGRVSDWSSDGRTPAQTWAEVCRLASEGEPVRLITEWGVDPKMLISGPGATKTHRGMRFTLKLVRINRIGMTDADLPPEQVFGPAAHRTGEVKRGRVVLPPVE